MGPFAPVVGWPFSLTPSPLPLGEGANGSAPDADAGTGLAQSMRAKAVPNAAGVTVASIAAPPNSGELEDLKWIRLRTSVKN